MVTLLLWILILFFAITVLCSMMACVLKGFMEWASTPFKWEIPKDRQAVKEVQLQISPKPPEPPVWLEPLNAGLYSLKVLNLRN